MPRDRKAIRHKWVSKVETTLSGKVIRSKARLCVQGFSQKFGVDYNEMFSPVAQYDSVRTLLSVAAVNDLEIYQFDIKTAYLNSNLKEEIYMSAYEGLDIPNNNSVCKFNKAL